jgi:hypothetical protein
MPVFYKIDKGQRLVMTTASGVVTRAEAEAHQEQLLNDPDFDPSFSQLIDVTQVTKLEASREDIRALSQRNVFSPNSRRAWVASSDLLYGIGRMFGVYRETLGERGIRICRTIEEALDWVLAKEQAP